MWACDELATRLALKTGRTRALAVFARNRPAQHAVIGALQRARDDVCTRVARETEGASATTVAVSDRSCFNAAVLALIFTRLNAFAFGLNLAVRTLARTSLVGRASDRSSIFAAGIFTRHLRATILTGKTQRTITTAVLLRNGPSADTTVQAFQRARHGDAACLALPPSRARLARTIAPGDTATELPAVLAFERARFLLLTFRAFEPKRTVTPAVTATNRSFHGTAIQTSGTWSVLATRCALETGRTCARTRLVRNIPTQHPVIGTLGTCHTGSTTGSLETERT